MVTDEISILWLLRDAMVICKTVLSDGKPLHFLKMSLSPWKRLALRYSGGERATKLAGRYAGDLFETARKMKLIAETQCGGDRARR